MEGVAFWAFWSRLSLRDKYCTGGGRLVCSGVIIYVKMNEDRSSADIRC